MEQERTSVYQKSGPYDKTQAQPSFVQILCKLVFGLLMLASACYMLFQNEIQAVQIAMSVDEILKMAVSTPSSQITSMENNGKLAHLKGPLHTDKGRAVQTAESIDEILHMTLSLPSSEVVSTENNGKLVHLKGALHTDTSLQDEEYNIGIQAVKLRRIVEMYQWVEHEHETKQDEGNCQTKVEKSYSYTQEWRSDIVDSSRFDNSFNYRNPAEMPVESLTYEAESVYVGLYLLSKGLVSQVTNFQHLRANDTMIKNSNLKVFDGFFYHGNNPTHPKVGDLRVKFEFAGISGDTNHGPPDQVSIVAQQMNNNLLPYQTLAGDPLEILHVVNLTAHMIEMMDKMNEKNNAMLTWCRRFLWLFFMCCGFLFVTGAIFDHSGFFFGITASLTNFGLAIGLPLTIIGIAWIFYLPWLGITLLVPGIIIIMKSTLFLYAETTRVDI